MSNVKNVNPAFPPRPIRVLQNSQTCEGRLARWSCVFLLCVYVGRIQELWSPLVFIHLGMVGLCFGVIACMSVSCSGFIAHVKSPQGRRIVGVFFCCVFSIVFSVWPSRSLSFTFSEFGLVLAFVGILLWCLRTVESVVMLMRAYVVCAIILAATSMASGGLRVYASSTYDPNDIALVLICGLPFLRYFYGMSQSVVMRLGVIGAAILMFAAIGHTGSRGGVFGLAAVMLFMLRFDNSISIIKRVVVVSLVVFTVFLISPDSLWERMESIGSDQDYNVNASSGRIEIWKRAVQMMIDNPLTGVGAGAFAVGDGIYQGQEAGKWSVTHNSFVEVGASVGVIGLYFFVRILFGAIVGMMHIVSSKFRGQDPRAPVALALAASLTGFCVCGFFLSQGFSSILYALVAMTMILASAPPSEASDSPEMSRSSSHPSVHGREYPSNRRR